MNDSCDCGQFFLGDAVIAIEGDWVHMRHMCEEMGDA